MLNVKPARCKLGMLEHVCSCWTTDVCQRNVEGESLKCAYIVAAAPSAKAQPLTWSFVTLRTELFSTATFCAITERNAAEFGSVDLLKVRRCVARTRRLLRCCAGASAFSARRTTEVGSQQTNGQAGRVPQFAHFPVRESGTSGALANGRPTLCVPIVALLLTSALRAATSSTLN
jgi:hypothetical protein